MKKLVLILATIAFLVTSVDISLADKGRDPPDPPVVPEPRPIERSLSVPAEKAPGAAATASQGVLHRGASDRGGLGAPRLP
ncbi:MAG: hypothetical protein GXX82_13805 [Syntrophorhabdus sp.]|nr:hypothetical protein [Syntrophorhabdus sp.]